MIGLMPLAGGARTAPTTMLSRLQTPTPSSPTTGPVSSYVPYTRPTIPTPTGVNPQSLGPMSQLDTYGRSSLYSPTEKKPTRSFWGGGSGEPAPAPAPTGGTPLPPASDGWPGAVVSQNANTAIPPAPSGSQPDPGSSAMLNPNAPPSGDKASGPSAGGASSGFDAKYALIAGGIAAAGVVAFLLLRSKGRR